MRMDSRKIFTSDEPKSDYIGRKVLQNLRFKLNFDMVFRYLYGSNSYIGGASIGLLSRISSLMSPPRTSVQELKQFRFILDTKTSRIFLYKIILM
jgi:hypothetical protein